MEQLTRHRGLLAPAVGAAVILAGMFSLEVGPVLSVVLGALVWGGVALMLEPDDPFAHLAALGFDGKRIARELQAAAERVQVIRLAASSLQGGQIHDSLTRIADAAQSMIDDLATDAKDYRRLRKPLQHYLTQVEKIAASIAEIGLHNLEQDRILRMRAMLSDLERVFQDYKRRMLESDVFDIDTRMELLETEMRSEGVLMPDLTPREKVADRGGGA